MMYKNKYDPASISAYRDSREFQPMLEHAKFTTATLNLLSVYEFNEFEPWLKSAKNQF